MILTGARIPASEALRLGIVERVVPAGEALTAAAELARTIAANLLLYEVSQDESDALSAAVATYRAALQKARHGGERSQAATRWNK